MKGSLKIWLVILGILVVGSAVTFFTHSYVTSQRKKINAEYREALPEAALAGAGETVLEEADEVLLSGDSPEADIGGKEEKESEAEKKSRTADDEEQAELVKIEVVEEKAEGDLQTQLAEYQKRFPELDRQIEQMRSSEVDNFVYSVKKAAQTERQIWERELEGLYHLLLNCLDENSARELRKEQDKWEKLRDSRAQEAGKKNSGGSLESVNYIASVAASTRERAYQLLEKYKE